MNTIDDLRATLQHHAADLPDELDHVRSAAVHQRVRVARQRRRTALGAGVAAALVLVLGSVGLVRLVSQGSGELQPLAGQTPPARLTSLGFGYAYAEGRDGDGKVSLDLDASDATRLVSWAGSTDDDVTVTTPARTLSSSDDFADFTVVSPGESGEVTVAGQGRVAIAVYTLDQLAPGAAADGVVFREQVAAQRLLAAGFGDAAHPVALAVTTPTGRLRLTSVCRNAPDGTWLSVELDGSLAYSGECNGSWQVDAGGGNSGTLEVSTSASYDITAKLTQGQDGPEVDASDVQYGIGVYAGSPSSLTGPFDISPEVEYDGHVWLFGELDKAAVGRQDFEVRLRTGQVYVVMHAARVDRAATVQGSLDGRVSVGLGGGGSAGLGVGDTGGVVSVSVDGDPGPRAVLGVATYTRGD